MGAELFGRSGMSKWYNGKKNGFLKWVVRGLGNECLWSTQPLVWKGAVKVQSIIVMAYLLSKAGNIKGFLLPAGSALSQGTVGGWWLLSGTGDDRAVKALTSLAELLWAPSWTRQGSGSSLVLFGAHTPRSQRKAWSENRELWHLANGGTQARAFTCHW